MIGTVSDPTSRANRTATTVVAEYLTGCLRLRRGPLRFLPFCVSLLRFLALRDRLLLRHLLALIVVIDAIAGAAGDLDAAVAIGTEAGVADQRTDAAGLAL